MSTCLQTDVHQVQVKAIAQSARFQKAASIKLTALLFLFLLLLLLLGRSGTTSSGRGSTASRGGGSRSSSTTNGHGGELGSTVGNELL